MFLESPLLGSIPQCHDCSRIYLDRDATAQSQEGQKLECVCCERIHSCREASQYKSHGKLTFHRSSPRTDRSRIHDRTGYPVRHGLDMAGDSRAGRCDQSARSISSGVWSLTTTTYRLRVDGPLEQEPVSTRAVCGTVRVVRRGHSARELIEGTATELSAVCGFCGSPLALEQ